jgi:predicted GNAT family N-acyltransferase
MKPTVQIRRVSSDRQMAQAFAIRLRVFVKEQGVPEDIELDRDDRRAIHFLAVAPAQTLGTARLVKHGHSAKIGRMAVLKSYRRKGIGKKLLMHAIAMAERLGVRKIYLHAQVPVVGFYEKLGFRAVGPVFEEAAILHRKMVYAKEVARRTSVNKKASGRNSKVVRKR